MVELDLKRPQKSFLELFLSSIGQHLEQKPFCFVAQIGKHEFKNVSQTHSDRNSFVSFDWFKYQRNLQSKSLFKTKSWKTDERISSLFSSSHLTVAFPFISNFQKVWFVFDFKQNLSCLLINNIMKICKKSVTYEEQKQGFLNSFLKQKLKSQEEAIHLLLHQFKTPLAEITRVFDDLMISLKKSQINLNEIQSFSLLGQTYMKSLQQRIYAYLDIVRIESHTVLKPLVLKKIVEDSIKVFSLVKNKIQIRVDVEDSILIMGNNSLLHQVFENLIQNAIDSLCEISHLKRQRKIKISIFEKREDCVYIQIMDSGKGLTLNQKEKVFDPFFSSKINGHGLGLFFCRKVMTAVGGSVFYHESLEPLKNGFCLVLKKG